MKKAIAVVDFGTSNVHANAIAVEDGQTIVSTAKDYAMISPKPGYCEMDANGMWLSSEECVGAMMERLPKEYEVCCLAFSWIGDSVLFLDEAGKPLHNLLLAFDARGAEQAERMNAHFGDDFLYDTLNMKAMFFASSAKILWFKENEPELMKKVRYYDSIQQYVFRQLGLPPLNDRSLAGRKSLYHYGENQWSKPLMDYVGVTEEQVGRIVGTGDVIGTVSSYGKVSFGRDIPVVPGGHDCDCGFLGTGAIPEYADTIGDVTGTYDHVGYIANGAINFKHEDKNAPLASCTGPLPDTSVCYSGFSTSGALMKWFMREIGGGTKQEDYARFWSRCNFNGENKVRLNPVFSANRGSIAGLDINTSKYELFQAIAESLTFECRRMVEQCNFHKNGSIRRVHIGGGATKSDDWMQLRADVTGIRFETLSTSEVSSLGSAILGAVAVGEYATVKDAVDRMIRVNKTFDPQPKVFERYQPLYEQYVAER